MERRTKGAAEEKQATAAAWLALNIQALFLYI